MWSCSGIVCQGQDDIETSAWKKKKRNQCLGLKVSLHCFPSVSTKFLWNVWLWHIYRPYKHQFSHLWNGDNYSYISHQDSPYNSCLLVTPMWSPPILNRDNLITNGMLQSVCVTFLTVYLITSTWFISLFWILIWGKSATMLQGYSISPMVTSTWERTASFHQQPVPTCQVSEWAALGAAFLPLPRLQMTAAPTNNTMTVMSWETLRQNHPDMLLLTSWPAETVR